MIFSEHIRDEALERISVPDDTLLESPLVARPYQVEVRPLPERINDVLRSEPGFGRIQDGVCLTISYDSSEKQIDSPEYPSHDSEHSSGLEREDHMTLGLGIKGYFAWTYIGHTITVSESGDVRVKVFQDVNKLTEREDFPKQHRADVRHGVVDQKNPRKGYAYDIKATQALIDQVLPKREDFHTDEEFAEDLILALYL